MDIRTLLISLAIGHLLFGAMFVGLRRRRPYTRDIPFWALAKVLAGSGVLLIVFRGRWPDWLTIAVANTLLLLGVAYEGWTMWWLAGRPTVAMQRRITSVALALVSVALLWLDAPARISVVSVLLGTLYAVPAFALLRGKDGASRPGVFLGWTYIVMTVLMAARAVWAQITTVDATVFSTAAIQEVGFVAVYIMMLITGIGVVLMAADKAEQRVSTLSRLLPICAWCKKIRKDGSEEDWMDVDRFLEENDLLTVSHSICPDCDRSFRSESGLWPGSSRTLPLVLIAAMLALAPLRVMAQAAPPTARQVVERIKSELGGTWTETGNDTFKDGDPATPVTGIAVTMMTTMDVLQRAAAAGLNLVITHEPTFYTGNDALTALENAHDSLTATKRAFIKEHHLVVFRLHDHWHYPTRPADPVLTGVFRQMDWLRYQQQPGQNIITIPGTTVGALASQLAKTLGANAVRVVGDATLRVSKIAYLPGAAGWEMQRSMLARDDVEVEIIGEAREWETTLYAADLVTLGRKKALITLGHVPSEQAGSAELVTWLKPLVPGMRVQQLLTADPYWVAR